MTSQHSDSEGNASFGRAWPLQVLDALMFSSVGAAAVAAALLAAAASSMGVRPSLAALSLAFSGTFFVYNVDRLRDRRRDRGSSPERTRFVSRFRRVLSATAFGSAVIALVIAVRGGPKLCALCAVVVGLGLLHRRLKHRVVSKTVYVTAAWLAVVVGIPAVMAEGARELGWVSAALAGAIAANVIASNLRGLDGHELPASRMAGLVAAGSCGLLGLGSALLAPPLVRPLAWVAGAAVVSLLAFRPTERYGLGVLDGALFLGGTAAWLFH